MAPPAIRLLDEEQQRALQETTRRTNSNGDRPSYRLGSFGGVNGPLTPPPVATRTNFTGGSGVLPRPKSAFGAEPRTNFTSGGNAPPRPVYDNHGGIAERPTQHSNDTSTSSPKTVLASHGYIGNGGGLYDPNDAYRDDTTTAMLDRPFDDDDELLDSKAPGQGYIGNSSGSRLSVSYVLIGALVGVALGILLSALKVSPLVATWVSVPGDLFLRALKALVIPYVFCSVAVAIGDIVFVGKISVVGLQTFKVFAIMWVTTAVLGMGVALLFRPLFETNRSLLVTPTNAVGFTCANNRMLELQADATLACSRNATALGGVVGSAAFEVTDVNNVYQKNVARALALMTVSDQILAILYLIVPKNIFTTLANGDLLSTITFAMVLGAVAGRNYFIKTRRVNYLYLTMLQLRNTFFLAMEWVIWLTPGAVISIIAGSFATNQDSLKELSKVYMYVLAMVTAAALQMLVTQPAILFMLTRCNPYAQMKHMTRAYIFAFGTSSSLATAPVTLACVKKARMCSQSLANFVVSIGACSNLSAMGFYFPIGIIWLAASSGNSEELTPWRLFAIFLLSVLGCAGTPPIPNAGIAIMASVYKTVFGVSDLPVTFPLYIAVDFFVDRISAMCDVNDDMLALKVIAENTDETIVGDHLGERE